MRRIQNEKKYRLHQAVTIQQESQLGATVFIRYPSRKYMDELISLTCSPDLLAAGLFPNSKEVTESFAAYNAVRNMQGVGGVDLGDPSILLVDVCCGSTPRTASTFAFRSKWNCVAIDPKLRQKPWPVRRLQCHSAKLEDVPVKHDGLVVVTAVHTHISRAEIAKYIDAPRILLVDMECCLQLEDAETTVIRKYEDMGIWSPKREITVSWLKGAPQS